LMQQEQKPGGKTSQGKGKAEERVRERAGEEEKDGWGDASRKAGVKCHGCCRRKVRRSTKSASGGVSRTEKGGGQKKRRLGGEKEDQNGKLHAKADRRPGTRGKAMKIGGGNRQPKWQTKQPPIKKTPSGGYDGGKKDQRRKEQNMCEKKKRE